MREKPFPRPGWFWAKLQRPSRMPPGEDWVTGDWEVVEVVDNQGEGDEEYGVFLAGIAVMQWPRDCVFGPEVARPSGFGEQPRKRRRGDG